MSRVTDVAAAAKAAGRAAVWDQQLSHGKLSLGDGGATAAKGWEGYPKWPAALVAVGRGDTSGEGFVLGVVVEAMPKYGHLSFGIGRRMAKEGSQFGDDADGTCGILQNGADESIRAVGTEGFGRRTFPDGFKLDPPVRESSRLALHLSPRGADGTRTARFFVDGSEVAVFAGIEDDGESSDWVAGVTLSFGALVRLVPVTDDEMVPGKRRGRRWLRRLLCCRATGAKYDDKTMDDVDC